MRRLRQISRTQLLILGPVTEAGKILGIKQPHVSALMRNRSGTFSVERFMDFLTALGQDVEITVRRTRKEHGEVSVSLPAPDATDELLRYESG